MQLADLQACGKAGCFAASGWLLFANFLMAGQTVVVSLQEQSLAALLHTVLIANLATDFNVSQPHSHSRWTPETYIATPQVETRA